MKAGGKLKAKDVLGILSGVQRKQTNDKKKQTDRKKVVGSSTARTPAAARPQTVAPIGQQIKQVLELARQEKKPLTYKQVLAKTRIDIDANVKLLKALQAHESITVDEILRTIRYRTQHNINSREEMLFLVRQRMSGIPAAELKDGYAEAEADLQALADDEQVFIIQNKESTIADPMIIFPNPMPMPAEVDDEIRTLLQSTEMPTEDTRIEAALKAAGIRKSKRTTQRLKVAMITDDLRRGRTKKKAAIRNVTNAHMMHLFEQEQGPID